MFNDGLIIDSTSLFFVPNYTCLRLSQLATPHVGYQECGESAPLRIAQQADGGEQLER
jgi:hypothetical protein